MSGVMTKLRSLNDNTIVAVNAGHNGLFTSNDLAMLTNSHLDANFTKFLYKAVKSEVLMKVCTNIFINPLAPPSGKGVLIKIANILHWDKFIYISLESQLSYLGVISQVTMNYLTLMTTGRTGLVKTKYGTIEFTHTSRKMADISDYVYYDTEISAFRAIESKAIIDLNRVGRNYNMLEFDNHSVVAGI